MKNKKPLLLIPVVVTAISLGVVFYPQEAEAHGSPGYLLSNLDVYQSSSTTLGSGTAICTGLNIGDASGDTCGTDLVRGATYRFEVTVTENVGDTSGTPTRIDMTSAVGAGDTLGASPGYTNSDGCDLNTDWTAATSGADVQSTPGTSCTVPKAGTAEFWFIITIGNDAGLGSTSSAYFVTDGTVTDTSDTVTFTIADAPATGTPNITSYDLYESESTTLGSGIAICTGVDADTAQTCGGQLTVGHTYRLELLVEETGGADFTATSFDLDVAVGDFDVIGDADFVGVSNYILNSGCEDHTDGTESYVGGTDVRVTLVTTTNCVINSGGDANDEFWIVFRIHSSAGGAVNPQMTFTITDGSTPDTSASQTFRVSNILE